MRPLARQTYAPLLPIFNRNAFHINPVVRKSLAPHYTIPLPASATPSELNGWSFQQFGLTYGFLYEASANPARKYDFDLIVEVPHDQPYLHPSDDIGLAEKAHIAAMIQHMIEPFTKTQLGGMFFEYEKACSQNGVNVVVDRDGPSVLPPLIPQQTRIHYGIVFPDDDRYQDLPKENIMLIEWKEHGWHHVIDCSEGLPQFYTSKNDRVFYMTKAEALTAIKRIKDTTRNDPKFQNIAHQMNLFKLMDYTKGFLSNTPTLVPQNP